MDFINSFSLFIGSFVVLVSLFIILLVLNIIKIKHKYELPRKQWERIHDNLLYKTFMIIVASLLFLGGLFFILDAFDYTPTLPSDIDHLVSGIVYLVLSFMCFIQPTWWKIYRSVKDPGPFVWKKQFRRFQKGYRFEDTFAFKMFTLGLSLFFLMLGAYYLVIALF